MSGTFILQPLLKRTTVVDRSQLRAILLNRNLLLTSFRFKNFLFPWITAFMACTCFILANIRHVVTFRLEVFCFNKTSILALRTFFPFCHCSLLASFFWTFLLTALTEFISGCDHNVDISHLHRSKFSLSKLSSRIHYTFWLSIITLTVCGCSFRY